MNKYWKSQQKEKLKHLEGYLAKVAGKEAQDLLTLIKSGASDTVIISMFESIELSAKRKAKAAYRQSRHRQASNHSQAVQALIELYTANCKNKRDVTLSDVCRWATEKLTPILRDDQLKRQGVTIIRPNS